MESRCKGLGMTHPQFFDVDNEMGLSPEQSQLLQKWNKLREKDKHLVSELIDALNE